MMPDSQSRARVRKKIDIYDLLENFEWPPELSAEQVYRRLQDDHDGTQEGQIIILFNPVGDAFLSTDKHLGAPLRFRNGGAFGGGSKSVRTRNALVILALAIELDDEEDKRHAEKKKFLFEKNKVGNAKATSE